MFNWICFADTYAGEGLFLLSPFFITVKCNGWIDFLEISWILTQLHMLKSAAGLCGTIIPLSCSWCPLFLQFHSAIILPQLLNQMICSTAFSQPSLFTCLFRYAKNLGRRRLKIDSRSNEFSSRVTERVVGRGRVLISKVVQSSWGEIQGVRSRNKHKKISESLKKNFKRIKRFRNFTKVKRKKPFKRLNIHYGQNGINFIVPFLLTWFSLIHTWTAVVFVRYSTLQFLINGVPW